MPPDWLDPPDEPEVPLPLVPELPEVPPPVPPDVVLGALGVTAAPLLELELELEPLLSTELGVELDALISEPHSLNP